MKKPSKTLTLIILACLTTTLQSCSHIKLKTIPATTKIENICIKHNDHTNIDDFEKTIYEQLQLRTMNPYYLKDVKDASQCNAILTYEADSTVIDINPNIEDAQISLYSTDGNKYLLGRIKYEAPSDIVANNDNSITKNLVPAMLNKLFPYNKQVDTTMDLSDTRDFDSSDPRDTSPVRDLTGRHEGFSNSGMINEFPWGKDSLKNSGHLKNLKSLTYLP